MGTIGNRRWSVGFGRLACNRTRQWLTLSERMFEKSLQIKTHGTRTRVRPSCLEAGMGNIVGEI